MHIILSLSSLLLCVTGRPLRLASVLNQLQHVLHSLGSAVLAQPRGGDQTLECEKILKSSHLIKMQHLFLHLVHQVDQPHGLVLLLLLAHSLRKQRLETQFTART